MSFLPSLVRWFLTMRMHTYHSTTTTGVWSHTLSPRIPYPILLQAIRPKTTRMKTRMQGTLLAPTPPPIFSHPSPPVSISSGAGDSSQDDEDEDMHEDNDSELSDEEDPAKLAIEAGSLSPRKGPTVPGTPGLHPGTPRRLGLGGMGGALPMHMSLADAVKEAVHKEQVRVGGRCTGGGG
jgi:hypothetical protein